MDSKGSIPSCEEFRADFRSSPKNLFALNVVTKNGIDATVLDRKSVVSGTHEYSHVITPECKATAQGASGRCWLFAALNVLRLDIIQKMGLEESFELSQAFLFFWDKFEKANYFLELIIRNPDCVEGSRLFDHLMKAPLNDGGQYGMIQNLVCKYGLVPKSVYPDAHSASASRRMRWLLTLRLRTFAKELRTMMSQNATAEELAAKKQEQMKEVYRVLCICLGEPIHPDQEFDWDLKEKKGSVETKRGLTPKTFQQLVDPSNKIESSVSLIHDPRNPYNALYTVQHLGNVVEGRPIVYLNVSLETLKATCQRCIVDLSKPVWFGCEVGKFIDRDAGIMDTERFAFDLTFDMKLGLSKSDRLVYGESCMTHAMVFTGVDLDDEKKPTKWKVENSWGDKRGKKGYYMMTDPWFDEYMFQAQIDRDDLSEECQAILRAAPEPVVLPPWDPMGALASPIAMASHL